MKLESYGILVNLRAFGERDAIAHVFTRDYGVMCGMIRGAQVARKNRPMVGQVGTVSWNARVDSQLGVFHFESQKNLAAPVMSNSTALGFMNSAFALVATLLPERENYESLFERTMAMLTGLTTDNCRSYDDIYLDWECGLLSELGYALDLSRCSGCGSREGLNYLSPKTGRAVCDNCAGPYIGRLFELPMTRGVAQKFLEKICADQGITIPIARKMI